MRTVSIAILVIIVLILSACSMGAKEEIQVTSIAGEGKATYDEAVMIDDSWLGNWIFLSDEVNGSLLIEGDEDKSQVNINLAATLIDREAMTSTDVMVEGTGKLVENIITFRGLTDNCVATIEKNNDIVSLKLEADRCHSLTVDWSGDYKRESSIEAGPLVAMENRDFNVHGVALGDSTSIVKSHFGNAPEEEKFVLNPLEWTLHYQDKYTQFFTVENKVNWISVYQIDRGEFEAAVSSLSANAEIELYTDQSTTNYLYNPVNNQLLFHNIDLIDATKSTLHLTYADRMFIQHLEAGTIVKVESFDK